MKIQDMVIIGGLAFLGYSIVKSKDVAALSETPTAPTSSSFVAPQPRSYAIKAAPREVIENQGDILAETEIVETEGNKVVNTIKYNVVSSSRKRGESMEGGGTYSGTAISFTPQAETPLSSGAERLFRSYGFI